MSKAEERWCNISTTNDYFNWILNILVLEWFEWVGWNCYYVCGKEGFCYIAPSYFLLLVESTLIHTHPFMHDWFTWCYITFKLVGLTAPLIKPWNKPSTDDTWLDMSTFLCLGLLSIHIKSKLVMPAKLLQVSVNIKSMNPLWDRRQLNPTYIHRISLILTLPLS